MVEHITESSIGTLEGSKISRMKPILYIAIGLILGYLLCNQCTRPDPTGANKGRSDTISVTTVDTFRDTHIVQQLRPYAVRDTVTVMVGDTLPVDTAAIVADYLRTRYYSNTFTDSLYKIEVSDTVSGNRLTGQGLAVEVYRTTVTNTVTNTIPQTGLMLGGAAHGPLFGVSALAGWQFRGTTVLGGYDVLNKQGSVGVMWRVGR